MANILKGSPSGFGFLASVCITLLTMACARAPKERFHDRLQIETIWLQHQNSVIHALNGYQRGNEFDEARAFFARVTGIELGVHTLPSGSIIPQAQAHEDFRRIRQWYAENNDRLCLARTRPERLRVSDGCLSGSVPVELRRRQARKIWEVHEDAVASALEGHEENDAFQNAVRFFSEVAGIEVDVDSFTMGYRPGPQANEDLERIQGWFARNKDRLYFDEDVLAVRIASR